MIKEKCICGSGKIIKNCCGKTRIGRDKIKFIINNETKGYLIVKDKIRLKIDEFMNIKLINEAKKYSYNCLSNFVKLKKIEYNKVLKSGEEEKILSSFIEYLEIDLEKKVNKHSLLLWLAVSRRFYKEEKLLDYIDDTNWTRNNIDTTIDQAILKYSIFNEIDLSYEKNSENRIESIEYNINNVIILDYLIIKNLCALFYKTTQVYRSLGKGEKIILNCNSFGSIADNKLIDSWENRYAKYGNFWANYGISSLNKNFGQNNVELKGYSFGTSINLTKPLLNEFSLYTKEQIALVDHLYSSIALDFNGLDKILNFPGEFLNSFEEYNKVTIYEFLYCLYGVNAYSSSEAMDNSIHSMGIRKSGYFSTVRDNVKDFLINMHPLSKINNSTFPLKELREKIYRDDKIFVDIFLDVYTFDDTKNNTINLWERRRNYLFYDLTKNCKSFIVDLTKSFSILNTSLMFVTDGKNNDDIKNKKLEDDTFSLISNEIKDIKIWLEPGTEIKKDKIAITDVDNSFIINNFLFLIENKSTLYNINRDKGERKYINKHWRKLSSKRLNQVKGNAEKISTIKEFDGGIKLPSGIKYILPILCTANIEYISSFDNKYWLNSEFPIILSPFELMDFLKKFNIDNINKDLLIEVK